jgi:Flp pilus assembly protein TadB
MRRRRRRRSRSRRGLDLKRSGPWIAVVGLAVLVWLAVSTAIYAPWWGVVLHVLVVIPVIVWVARWARTRPVACTFVPLAGLPLLALVTAIGVGYGGWSA